MAEQIDRLEIQIEAQASKANHQLDDLIDRLGRVSDSLANVNTSGLTGLANGVQKFSNASATLKQVKTSDFTRLAKNISNLSSINTEKIYSAASSMTILGKSLTNLGEVSQSSIQIADVAKSISKIGGSNVQKAITNLPLLATAMKELMQTLSGAPRVNENIIQMTNALARLSSQGAKVGTASKSLSAGMERYSTSASKATGSTKGLASSIGMFYAKCFLTIRAVKALGKAVESSMDFLETSNYFEVAFGKIGGDAAAEWQKAGKENAEAYAQSFSERAKELTAKMTGYIIDESGNAMSSGMKNLGLNPDDVMQWQAVYAQMTDSLGIAEESTLRFSKALTMLGTDWASLRNISLDTSWNKFASALAGQSRAVRSLGIDVTQTTLQEYAFEYGITKSVMAMNQAEKAQLRLLAMLRQSEVAFGDLANTIGSPANQLRILEQNFANLARSIGNLFLPVVTKVLPYINGLVIALQRLFQWVGALLGIKFSSINSAMGGMDDSMGDFVGGAEDAGDALDKANAAAKKLKSTVLGIDELNINAPQEASGGSGGSAGGAGGGSAILDAEIEKALAEYEKKWNEAFDRMENKAQEFADRIANAFKKIWDFAEPTRNAISRLWNEGLSQLGNFTWDTLGDFYREFLVPVGKWMLSDSAGLPRLFNVLNKMLTDVDWGNLRNSLYDLYGSLADLAIFSFDALFDFVEYFLAPLGTWVMSSALPQLADIISGFIEDVNWEKINASLERFWRALAPFAMSIGQGIINFYSDLAKVGASFINIVVPGGLNALSTILENIDPRTVERIGYALGILLTSFMGFKAVKGLEKIIGKTWKAIYGAEIITGLKKVTKSLGAMADTIPIVTKALAGNKNAANALATFYPNLNSKIVSVSDAFGNLKANLDSGAFFKNTATDLRAWGDSLSTVQKGAIGAVAVFAEFTMIKDAVYDITMGTDNLVAAIGKIAIAAGAASGALYLAFGPAGLVVGAIAGVAGAIMGINKAMDDIKAEAIGNTIKNAFESPGGVSIDEISNNFTNAMGEIANGFGNISTKSSELKIADENINSTKTSIEAIKIAMDNGTISVEEGCQRSIEAFTKLATEGTDKIAILEETLLSALGEGGILYQSLIAMGHDVDTLKGYVVNTAEEAGKKIEEWTEELNHLKETDPTNPKIQELNESLLELLKTVDETYMSLGEYKRNMENTQVDLSKFIDGDKLDDKALANFLTSISTAFTETQGTVEERINDIMNNTEAMKGLAEKLGLEADSQAFKNAMSAYAKVLEETNGDLAAAAKAVTDTLELQLVEEISNVIAQAEKDWEENPLGKGLRGDYVQDVVKNYQDNIITPMSEQIESAMKELGIEGAGWSNEVGQTLVDGLFDVESYDWSGITTTETVLKGNYMDMLSKTFSSVKTALENGGDLEAIGKAATDGMALGMEPKTIVDAMMNVTQGGIDSAAKTQDSNSPSKVYMALGKDAVDGYNLGFLRSKQSSIDAVSEWMNAVANSLSQDTWYEIFAGIPLGFQLKWSELSAWWTEEAMPLWFEEGVSPWFSEEKWMETTDGMKLGIEGKWSEFAEQWKLNIAKWWSTDVTPWFSLTKWQLFGENMKNGLYLGFEGIVKSIAGILNSLTNVFEYSMNQIVDAVNDFVKDYNEAAGIMGTDKLERFSHFSFADLPKYEAGGFPEDGLFFANHTELVGEFTNGRTAVANNDMITAGIEEAAYRGFSRAYSENDREASLLEELIEAVREGRSISIDGRELVSVYDDRKRRNGYQFT